MMRLKTLTLHGFKSFARPTTVEFSPGLNVIVGPNGSGKSNLLDALRWALGERTRDTKRSQASQVIFHGSSSSKPLGMASVEVEWVDDQGNSSSIERRIFSAGEGEYFWNGSKVRLLDIKNRMTKYDFSLAQLSMGIVTNDSLSMLFDWRPSERFKWLEEINGVTDIRTQLNALVLRLQKAKEREKRFQERLKELELQIQRLTLLAKEEEAYLRKEREFFAVRKLYIHKFLRIKEEKHEAGVKERTLLERNLTELSKNMAARQNKIAQVKERLKTFRDHLGKGQREKEEIEKAKRKDEENLYYLLTRWRESLRNQLFYQEKLRLFDKEVGNLERKVADWLNRYRRALETQNWERMERVFACLREKKTRKLSRLEEQRFTVEKSLAQAELRREQVIQDIHRRKEQAHRVALEMERLQEECDREEKQSLFLVEREREIIEELRKGIEKLERKRDLLARIEAKLTRVQSGVLTPKVQDVLETLKAHGWTQRSLYALSWFLQDKEWYGEEVIHLKKWSEEKPGKCVVFDHLSVWKFAPLQEIQALLQDSQPPLSTNIVASDGSCILLPGGFLFFPLKVISPHQGARFLRSLQRRRERVKNEIEFAKKEQEILDRERQKVEKMLWESRVRLQSLRERLKHQEEENHRITWEMSRKEREVEQIEEEIRVISKTVSSLHREKTIIKRKLEKVEQIWQKIKEKVWEKKKIEEERDRLSWEITALHQKLEEMKNLLSEEQKVYTSIRGNLKTLIPLFIEHQSTLERQTRFLEGEKSKEERLCQLLEMEEEKFKEEEREYLEILERKEKLETQEGRLVLEVETLRQELGKYEDGGMAEDEHCFSSWEIKQLENFIREREAWLKSQKIRRGSIEELQELQERYNTLSGKDREVSDLIHRAEGELNALHRESKKVFEEFLRRTQQSFEYYFEQVFNGGTAYFLRSEEEIEVEVRIPSKRRQSLTFLSSGERALVAICLLLAVLEARNFPFCFLDEVDANLDHMNSKLFAQLLVHFARSRQIIIITHQEEVMERAQNIIGVTMNEPGVSQIMYCEPALGPKREEACPL